MTLLFAIGFVLLHAVGILLLPAHVIGVSYTFLVIAPLLATGAALQRALKMGNAPSLGWSLASLSLLLWTLGMVSSMREDIFLNNSNTAPGESMLLYVLYGVPIFYAVAILGAGNDSRTQHVIDAVLAASLGYLYYALMFSWTTLRGDNNPQSTSMIAMMFDVENVFLVITTTIRFFASDTLKERHLFGALATFSCLYGIVAAYYNHHVALDLAKNIGSIYDPIVDVPFLVFAMLAWHAPFPLLDALHPSPGFVRFVRSGSPLLLALAVLLVAILLLRQRFELGVAGVVVAVLGYGLRSTLSQVHQSQTEEELRNDRTALVELAMRDSLTGIPNRRAFEDALKQEWRLALRTQHTISLLLIDVDFFKQYNDRYGHLAGDECLRNVAATLQHAVQRPTDMLARYGGEEFALILPDTPQHGAKDVATRLCSAVRHLEIEHEGADTHKVTISIGVASTMPASGGTPEELVAAADQALYRAKHNGRNRVEQTA